MKKILWNKHNGRCSYGSRRVKLSDYGQRLPTGWEIEHGQPLSKEGVDDGRNKRLACWACNRFKGDMTASEWSYRIKTYYGGSCPRWYNDNPVKNH